MVDANRKWADGTFANGGYTNRAEKALSDLTGKDFIEVMTVELLPKLKEQLEEAKLRCEDEDDDTSLGEYMGLKAAIQMVEEFITDAPRKLYMIPTSQQFSRLNDQTLYQYYSAQNINTGGWITGSKP